MCADSTYSSYVTQVCDQPSMMYAMCSAGHSAHGQCADVLQAFLTCPWS